MLTKKNNLLRNSNFEILRIISMLFIIAGHLTIQSGILNTNSFNKLWAIIFGSAFGIADNIFILISSYFLTDCKFSVKRVLKVYLEVLIITIPLTLISAIFIGYKVDLNDIIRGLFPYSGSPLWFATCYITMLLFSPFLNKILNNEKITKQVLVLLFFINVIPSTFLFRNDFFYSGESVWFCFLYLLVGYFKKYATGDWIKNKSKYTFLLIAILIYIGLVGLYFGINIVGNSFDIIAKLNSQLSLDTYFITRYHTLPVFICSICIFIFVATRKSFTSNVINFISSGVFSVYVIHQTPAFAPFMWNKIFMVDMWMFDKFYPLYYILCVLLIFIIGCLIGIIVKRTIEPLLLNSKIFYLFQRKLECFYDVKD